MLGESARGLFASSIMSWGLIVSCYSTLTLFLCCTCALRVRPRMRILPAPSFSGSEHRESEDSSPMIFSRYNFHYPVSFHILPHSFALTRNLTLLFSSNSALFAKNTGGGVVHTYLMYGSNFKVHQ